MALVEIIKQDRKRVVRLKCDHCCVGFEKNYTKCLARPDKHHFCSRNCRAAEMKAGGKLARDKRPGHALKLKARRDSFLCEFQKDLRNVDDYHLTGRRSYVFDALLDDTILVECDGTFWHADRRVYQHDDMLSFPGGEISASAIWERDRVKSEYATTHGYTVYRVRELTWENDLKDVIDEIRKRQ